MKVWEINGEEYTDIEETVDTLTSLVDDLYYDDYLNETNDYVKVCGFEFDPSYALKELNPVAYSCGKSDFEGYIREEVEESLEAMDDGETQEIYGVSVECREVKSKKTA